MEKPNSTNYSALYTLVSVFFFWGFIASSNGVLIPFAKSYFNLSQFQSQLIDSAFYFAYYIGAFILFIISVINKKDLLNTWGLKSGIVYGLMISVVGAFFMFPALAANSFAFILAALFIIALGFSLQQTAANPFAISLGDEKTGAHRLNLAGGVNSLGTTLGPIFFALALFGTTKLDESLIKTLNLGTVQKLYIIVGMAFLGAALLFKFSKKLPNVKANANIENEGKATLVICLITLILVLVLTSIFYNYTGQGVKQHTGGHTDLYLLIVGISSLVVGLLLANYSAKKRSKGWGAFKYPQLILGMIAIFVYVGTEVTIQSNLGEYLKYVDFQQFVKLNPLVSFQDFNAMMSTEQTVAKWSSMTPLFVSLYWGSLMIGRWAGALAVFNWANTTKKIALIIVPYITFLVVLGANYFAGVEVKNLVRLWPYTIVIFIQILGFLWGEDKPAKTLLFFGILGVIAMAIGIFTAGSLSIFAFVSGGLFCSVMWPCIFSLSLQGLGKYKSQGSAFLIMMILGGAFLPPLQGKVADMFSINTSYYIPLFGFVYITMFAVLVRKVLKQQIAVDSLTN